MKTTGTTTNVNKVDMNSPPTTAIAIGALASDPAPSPTAIGSMPAIIAVVVIAHGGWQIRSGNADQGKMSIVGGLLLGLAVVIAEALFNAGGMPTIGISR